MPCKQPEFAGLEDSLHCSFFVLLLFQWYTQLIPSSILFFGFLHCKHGWRLRFGNCEIFARYNKAIVIYEDVAKQSMSNNLLKYSVKGYLLNAGLCQICGKDVVAINNALEKYQVCFYQSCLLDAFVYQPKARKVNCNFDCCLCLLWCRSWIQPFQAHGSSSF
jgi:hypothetical protein